MPSCDSTASKKRHLSNDGMCYAQVVDHSLLTSNFSAIAYNSKHADDTAVPSRAILRKRHSNNRHPKSGSKITSKRPSSHMLPSFSETFIPPECRPIQTQYITERGSRLLQTVTGTIHFQFEERRLLEHQSHPSDSSASEDLPEETFSARIVVTPASHMGLSSQVILEVAQALTNKTNILSTPTLSFRPIVPRGSEIFRIIQCGSTVDLQKAVSGGTASLADCDPKGRSLLNVGANILIRLYKPTT